MASYEPPKFKPFTRTKVVLALEPTPLPIDQKTDITAIVPTAFRDAEGQGPAQSMAAAEGALASGPEDLAPGMFKALKKKRATVAAQPVDATAGMPDFAKETLRRQRAPGAPRVYARLNVVSRDIQAAEIGKLPLALKTMANKILDVETTDPYAIKVTSGVFVPTTRRGFGSFIVNKYAPIFPTGEQRQLDAATCAAKGDEGVKEVKIYHYQAFIREYLRYETPYRGLLVYHGLGSGKTCSAIAAAEALFGTRGSKIIVMTPASLRGNFIDEVSFCGFKHFRLQNHWTSLSLTPGSDPEPGLVKLFAQNVYGIPESYFARRARGRAQLNKIWIPTFDSPPNYNTLTAEERQEIKEQLEVTIQNRIKFINYNGITAAELKTMVCSMPDGVGPLDNSVVVVDEIHNIIRLIQGSLEFYLGVRPGGQRTQPLESFTPDRKLLPYCDTTQRYRRGYLFYRLFMDAKNTKIIGLSGTPLINFPEELGILMNILHGLVQVIEFVVTVEGGRDVRPIIEELVNLNVDLDTVFFQASEGSMSVTVSRLPEQFTKVLNADQEILGIRRRDPGTPVPSLEQVWVSLQEQMKAKNVRVQGSPTLKAQELLPSWDTPFRGAFLQEDGITLKNSRVLQKRIRGLISHYRGIQGDVMPKVTVDKVLGIPLTGYSLKVYNKLRNQEIQIEMKKPKDQGAAGDAVWAEIKEISSMKTPSNYRMSSRQACNFAFPEGVTRPRPRSTDEQDVETGRDRDIIVDADIEEKAPGRDDDAASVADSASEGEGEAGIKSSKDLKKAYQAALQSARAKLRSMGATHLRLDGPNEHNLAKYSPKFAAMLQKIMEIPGSSLVYSNFLEMEGIGIFGICMEANGFVPIQIVNGADGKLKFSDATAASLAKGPSVKEMRYIEFTGAGSKEQRGAAVNIFNARLDKLPAELQKVLKDAGWENNFDGGLCRAFCITSAGAEGLSLKCVRGVHIMEPYWNTVRTQQVKGRAVRICSHVDLPKDQQNVEIYTYCTIIPEEAVLAQAVDKTLERSDTYSSKDAEMLGVPVPEPAKAGVEIPAGMFEKVDAEPEAPVGPGAEASLIGPIRFSTKLANEYGGFTTFAPSPVVIQGKRYPTLEHYFCAMQFTHDLPWQETIRVAATPLKARQLAAQADHPVREDWDRVKESVMLDGLREKFKQNKGLLDLLKSSGSRPLIYASTDAYWGEGRTGKGKNRYGHLLEQVREELREFLIPLEAAAVQDLAAAPEPLAAAPEPLAAAEPLQQGGYDDLDDNEDEEDEEFKLPFEGEGEEFEEIQEGGVGEDRTILLTSDQKVLLISLRKERVIGSLQTLMKTVAVDCQLNFKDNNDGSYRCLSLGNSIGDFAYHPNLQKDIQETEARFKLEPTVTETKPAPSRLTYKGKDYFYKVREDESQKGYIIYETTDLELQRPVGFIASDPDTKLPTGEILPPT